MWKSIVLCVSLFGGAALGLAVGARFVEASALPAAAAIGLCLIGVVLILAAPANEVAGDVATLTLTTPASLVSRATPIEPYDLNLELNDTAPMAAMNPVSNHTPGLPFQALQS